jgi:hypothetical protein
MFDCRALSRLISEGLERRLGWLEWLLLGVHLLGCPPCRRFRRGVRLLHRALPSAPAPGEARLSPQARQRIARALKEAGG